MPYQKELPQVSEGLWWGCGEKISYRLWLEKNAMSDFFNKEKPTTFKLPKSSWDAEEIKIITHSLGIEEIRGFQQTERIDLGWIVCFSMNDSDVLCSASDKYWMWIFYPTSYPYDKPLMALNNEKQWFTDPPHHHLPSFKISEAPGLSPSWVGTEVPIICHCELDFHIAGKTTALDHAKQGILWLRSKLNQMKNGSEKMKDYVGG